MLAEDFKAVFPQIGDRAVAVGSERDARISMMRHDPLSPPVSSTKPLEVSLLLQLTVATAVIGPSSLALSDALLSGCQPVSNLV